jgi:hypothetical protein
MAARKTLFDPQYVRDKIQTSQLINRLMGHVNGSVKLESTQVTAALGLLKKTVPDLAATQHSGPDGGPLTVNVVRFGNHDPK